MIENDFSFAVTTRRAIAVLRGLPFFAVAAADRKWLTTLRGFAVVRPAFPAAKSILPVALAFVCFGFLAGCHSNFVQATLVNRSGAPLRLVQVDYPSASFGTTNLNNAAEYHYRFKIQGSGTVKLNFVDSTGKPHKAVGPELDEGQEGALLITIDESENVLWTTSFAVNK